MSTTEPSPRSPSPDRSGSSSATARPVPSDREREVQPTGDTPDRALVEQIALLESLQHTLAAAQSALTRRFTRQHVAARIAAGETDPARLERSVAGQVALACRISPTGARQRVHAARDRHEGLDHVRGLFAAGELSRAAVDAIVRACRDLDRAERIEADRRLGGHDLTTRGLGRIEDLARGWLPRSPRRSSGPASREHGRTGV